MPKYSELCAIDLQSEEDDSAFYDDWMLFLLNDHFIGGPEGNMQKYVQHGMQKVGPTLLFDYTKIAGLPQPETLGGFCAGKCEFPDSGTTGRFSLTMDSQFFEELLKDVDLGNELVLSNVIMGNTNSPTDCEHTGFEFKLEVAYLE